MTTKASTLDFRLPVHFATFSIFFLAILLYWRALLLINVVILKLITILFKEILHVFVKYPVCMLPVHVLLPDLHQLQQQIDTQMDDKLVIPERYNYLN